MDSLGVLRAVLRVQNVANEKAITFIILQKPQEQPIISVLI